VKNCKQYIKIIDGDSESYHHFTGKEEAKEFFRWAKENIPSHRITIHYILSDDERSVEENTALALAEFYDRAE